LVLKPALILRSDLKSVSVRMPLTSETVPVPLKTKLSEQRVNWYWPVVLFHWIRLPDVLSFKQVSKAGPTEIDDCTSKAPMSTWLPDLRGKPWPRWSAVSVNGLPSTESSPASMAGLPASRAIVGVGPPLSNRGPSFGSPDSIGLQLPSLMRL